MRFDYTIVIPARNESTTLQQAMERLIIFCQAERESIELIIVENGSTDTTWKLAQELSRNNPSVTATQSALGKGAAILHGWKMASAPVVLFLDADLSPSLETLPHLYCKTKTTGGCAIADRFLHTSHVDRGRGRTFISRVWAGVASRALSLPHMDYQCGAKAIPSKYVDRIERETTARDWCFDLELVWWFYKEGLPLSRVATTWTERVFEERSSSLPIVRTSFRFLIRLWNLRHVRHLHQSLVNQVERHQTREVLRKE